MRRALARMTLVPLLWSGCLQITTSGLLLDGGSTTDGGLSPGAPCGSNKTCGSGICGLNGSGNCCAAPCSTATAICGATGCDDAGACVYPAPCPGHLACNDAGTACDSTCNSSADCAEGFSCNAGLCVKPEPVGSCTENDDCLSGVCGLDGTGYCCVSACFQGAPCGASGCDPFSGACQYPDAGVACGQEMCAGGLFQPAPACQLGSCIAGQSIDCAPYQCNAGGCLTSCNSDADCVHGYCDLPSSTCCSLPSNATIDVDSATWERPRGPLRDTRQWRLPDDHTRHATD